MLIAREQDEEALLQARSSLKFLTIQGTEDNHLQSEKVEHESKATFSDTLDFYRLDGTGHAVFYEEEVQVNQMMLTFVEKCLRR